MYLNKVSIVKKQLPFDMCLIFQEYQYFANSTIGIIENDTGHLLHMLRRNFAATPLIFFLLKGYNRTNINVFEFSL